MRKSHWQDWALIVALTIIAIVVGVAVPGCASPSPTPAECSTRVLVFHADWCRWCPTTAEINALQKQFPNCEIVDVDIDKYPDVKAEYGVRSIPHFVVETDDGYWVTQSINELRKWLSNGH